MAFTLSTAGMIWPDMIQTIVPRVLHNCTLIHYTMNLLTVQVKGHGIKITRDP